MAGYKFPEVDFSWLGELPGKARDAGAEFKRKQVLADLDASDADSLRKKGTQLIALGDLKSITAGKELHSIALSREALSQKGASDKITQDYIHELRKQGGLGTMPGGARAPAAPPQEPPEPPFGFGTEAAPPPWPTTTDPLPGQRPGAAPIPPGFSGGGDPVPGSMSPEPLRNQPQPGWVPKAPPPGGGLTQGPPPDTVDMLAQAPLPPRGPQMAQAPGPVSDAPPQGAPPPGAPPPAWLQGAQTPAPPVGPPRPAAKRPPIPGETPDRYNARLEAEEIYPKLIAMPPGMTKSPAYKVLFEQFKDAMRRAGAKPEHADYQLDNLQRAHLKLPPQTLSEWKLEQTVAPKRREEVAAVQREQEKKNVKAPELIATLNKLEAIVNDPAFQAGELAPRYGRVVNLLSSAASLAGISMQTVPDIAGLRAKVNGIVEPHLKAAALMQEFTALSNSALVSYVDGFKQNFSNTDREFTEKIFPQVLGTPDGIRAVGSNLKAMAEHAVGVTRAGREYMETYGNKATEAGLHNAMDKYKAEHPLFVKADGTPTARGLAIQNAVAPAPPAPPPAPPPAAARPSSDAPAPGRRFLDKGKIWTWDENGRIIEAQ